MTHATVLRGIEVARVLSGRRSAIVAGRTGAENLVVIHRCNRRPNRCAVAILADGGRLYVSRVLGRCADSIVAADAIINYTDVFKHGG